MIKRCEKLAQGAQNLLLRCAELSPSQSLLLICEDPGLGWYDDRIAEAIVFEANALGIAPTILNVGAPHNGRDCHINDAIAAHDCTIFLSRIGDQDRFAAPVPGKKSVMCYTRDGAALASDFGRADHLAFSSFKAAIDTLLLGASEIRLTCALGTALTGQVSDSDKAMSHDVSVRRFPLGVPQPINAAHFSGQIAVANFLSPTGSLVYEPASLPLAGAALAEISNGRICGLSGDEKVVSDIRRHHEKIAAMFAIDGNIIHSFHAGIHPGCAYSEDAAVNPDRWSNTVFGNPRILHFHTCGNYAPGEICWMVIDPTITIDGIALWDRGQLRPQAFAETNSCLEQWPELKQLFSNPAQQIGLSGH